MSKPIKPLQVNPIKHSSPMGALLAFLGVDKCMPLMHGAQGCASFSKVLFTRHFCEPIAVQTTAVNDITAVLDGGDKIIAEAVENIIKKVEPELIGLFTTGLTETKGDDIKGAAKLIDREIVYVNTPDYEDGLEGGWAKATKAIIEQLVEPKNEIDMKKVLVLPNVNMTPLETEKLKLFLESFGLSVYALPDLSTSLDGYLGEKQGSLSGGGINVKEIKNLANSRVAITIGDSMESLGDVLKTKNHNIKTIHFSSLSGLEDSDSLVDFLCNTLKLEVPQSVKRWRDRLRDMMLDAHFIMGKLRFGLIGEADLLVGISKSISEVGGKVELGIVPEDKESKNNIVAKEILVGDFEDLEKRIGQIDVIVGNFHAEKLAHKYRKKLFLIGYPNYEEVGNQLSFYQLYEGSSYFLKDIANKVAKDG